MKNVSHKATANAAAKAVKINPNAKIKILVKDNPKHPGSGAETLYNLYRPGMTAAAYVQAVRAQATRKNAGWLALKWDIAHGYVSVS
jgi:hypothetical protein